MTSIPCDIVLLPDIQLAEKAISASQKLADYDSFFTLEFGKFFPHMSLYMFQLHVDDIQKASDLLQSITDNTSLISATATKYVLGEGYATGYIDPEYEVTDSLRALQNTVVEAINPVRAGMREKDMAKMQNAEGLKLENLQNYGYTSIGKLFRPHMTLTRLKENTPESLNVLPDVHTFNGVFDRVGLFEMGDNGTCIRMIAEYKLGTK